jgi:hypothetical protein
MKNAFKKAFTGAVAVLTIIWSIGIVNLPMTAKAASAGDVIKGTTLSTVYYYGSDGSRYAFPNEKTYLAWYEDFSGVKTLTDSALAAIPLAGNIVYRPGSRWIKIQSDPKTYAVTTDGTIRWIETEDVAEGLAGSDWNAFIDDVSDTFFVDYTVGTSLMSAADAYEGALVADGSDTYLIWGGEKLLVSDMDANRFQTRFVLDGASIDLDGITTGTELAAEDSEIVDTAQLGGTTSTTTGGLSVSLASDTPASATIPDTVDAIPFATWKLTATDGAVDVSAIQVKMGGIAPTTNISNVYLYEGDTRLTNSKSINSTTRLGTFGSLGLSFEDGETKYITLRADIASLSSSGDSAYFEIVDADAITTDSEVSGSFPVTANSMTFSTTTAGTLTVTKSGTVANPTLGEEGATLAKVLLAASTEGASVYQIAFNVDNAADHDNFKLYNGTTLLSTGTRSAKTVTFSLSDPLVIDKGGNEIITLKGDVGGESTETITVAIEESADVMATGSIYGFNMNIDITAYDEEGATCSTECTQSTIQGGELTFAFNGPSSADIAVDSNDQTLMKFTVTAANWVEIQALPIVLRISGGDNAADDNDLLNQTASDANYTDISVRLEDGTVWMGPEELSATNAGSSSTDDVYQTLTFDDYQSLQAGESVDAIVTVDVGTDTDLATAPDLIRAEIDVSAISAEDSNGDTLSSASIVPSADVAGYYMTLVSSALTVTSAATPWDASYVIGTNAVQMAGYSFVAGESSDITVSAFKAYIVGDDDGAITGTTNENDITYANDHLSSCSIYDGVSGALVDGPEGITTANTGTTNYVSFDSFEWVVAAGETERLVVKCDLANATLESSDNDLYNVIVADDGDMTAEDAEGDSVDILYDYDNDATEESETLTSGTDMTECDHFADIIANSVGTLTVAAAADQPSSTIILGNSTGVTVHKLKFTTTKEAFVIKKVTFAQASTTPSATVADSVAAAVHVAYTNSDGAAETKTGYVSGQVLAFDNMDMYVGKDASAYLTVTIDTTIVDSTTIDGATFDLDLDSSSASEFEAIGESSGDTLDGTELSGSDPSGNAMTLYKTKPTISLASGSPSGAGMPGLSEVFRFNIAADSRGYVTLNEVIFKMTSTDNTGTPTAWNKCDQNGSATYGIDESDLSIYDTSDMSTALDAVGDSTEWKFYDSSDGSECTDGTDVVDYIRLILTTADEIAAGTTVTYGLYLDTTGASAANDDSLRLDLDTNTNTDAGVTGTVGTIKWADDAYDTSLYASLVKTLPVTGGTILY